MSKLSRRLQVRPRRRWGHFPRVAQNALRMVLTSTWTTNDIIPVSAQAKVIAQEYEGVLAKLVGVNKALKKALDGDASDAIAGAMADGEAYGRACERGRAARAMGYLELAQTVAEVQIELQEQYPGYGELKEGLGKIWTVFDKLTGGGACAVPVRRKAVDTKVLDEELVRLGCEGWIEVGRGCYRSATAYERVEEIAREALDELDALRQEININGPGAVSPCPECGRSCTCP